VPARDRKNTQRERLLAGMLAAANHDGYDDATVSNVTARAGVSRPTFYRYFTDRDDCFLALHRDIAARLIDHVGEAVAHAQPEHALGATVRALIALADSEPDRAYFLSSTALAGGPRALEERERVIGQITVIAETSYSALPRARPAPDLPAEAVIGAAQRLIARGLRRGERDFAPLEQALSDWLGRYERPAGQHRWRTLKPGPNPEPLLRLPGPLDGGPSARAGRSRVSRGGGERARKQRWRILTATADSAAQRGFAATTVSEIMARARFDRRVFYEHFRDKQQAFLAVHELAFEQTMSIAAGAYLSARQLPERVWRGIRAASQFQAAYPAIAHVGYLESHALGPPAIQRADDSSRAFAILLHTASERTRRPQDLPVAEAIGAAIFEIARNQVRLDRARDLPRYAFHATYICLAPLLGAAAANEFLDAKVNNAC
jgi:AcrR family transcriptional regulator